MISEDIQYVVNTIYIIEEARRTSVTVEEQVQMNDNGFNLIEIYMKLFESHIDTASLHQMQVPGYPRNVLQF